MIRDFFWLADDQFARLEPLLPTNTRGKPRLREPLTGASPSRPCRSDTDLLPRRALNLFAIPTAPFARSQRMRVCAENW
jgi:hypothetical protein